MSPALVVVTLAAGGVAAVARYLLSVATARVSKAESFPWAVLIVNVVGSGLGGVVLGLARHAALSPDIQLIVLTGVCGGLTTFSTFSVETIQLLTHGRWRAACLSVGLNLVVGIGACTAGYLLAA
ncbi:CrcB protein [Cryobacterium mesophilum]|uniref:Fluoride-specific ion channel FluC n=1 Tax=Terrimesophilobacter mesophilus TaxID=433647 RepID=A0A4R8VCY9_9MICO|nr:fluoride efflux transporter CrcB [Terrimesophilobacter mesophilus]MBB5633237.1 CrcB protein [Terrimesophilobacter mesophilus]TFB79982.1 fluoride efflux transporter CrcB [Terrimesophilobacter mesophilus]